MRWLSPEDAEAARHLPPRRRARPRGGRAHRVNRERFPGLAATSWARLDGPAGTQMVDTAIEAMDAWMRSGRGANQGGAFAAAHATDELVASARASAGALLGAPPVGDRLRLQHDRADDGLRGRGRAHARARRRDRLHAPGPRRQRPPVGDPRRARGRHACASPSPTATRSSCPRARSRPCSRSARAGSRSPTPPTPPARSPTSPGSSPPPTRAGARVYVDAVHAAPHRRIDVAALGCDALACSAYKWFGPHIGVQWARPELLAELPPDKLLPSPDTRPRPLGERHAAVRGAGRRRRGRRLHARHGLGRGARARGRAARRPRSRASTRSPASPSTAAPATAPRR